MYVRKYYKVYQDKYYKSGSFKKLATENIFGFVFSDKKKNTIYKSFCGIY